MGNAEAAEVKRLQALWRELYSKILPTLAHNRDAAQPKWPVTLDHCFARIILDNTIGEGREQWDKRLKRPAVTNMTREQLVKAIEMAERIKDGDEDLVALDLRSLETRDRDEKTSPLPAFFTRNESMPKRRKAEQNSNDPPDYSPKRAKTSVKQSTLSFAQRPNQSDNIPSPPLWIDVKVGLSLTLHRIHAHLSLTPYRKRLYAALLSVPSGRYTTYAALADYLGSSARAVGNGTCSNPFAPDVPCHRVLASDGSMGGFGGSWGADGGNASKKLELLRKEGIKFNGNGIVQGPPFRDFAHLRATG
ncbi:hypothetical protein GJ744_000306 [Endocarpon pusillum]|uniref:Methylated-DNA--protein-cysteine methyltransferase n=1 Tax=Endocarpon pusillum TaxID=364733 RepID=A0A8H7E701_9EURO|nr:hypothetical protein GJ744_000306 [Endocarpon pusillum]